MQNWTIIAWLLLIGKRFGVFEMKSFLNDTSPIMNVHFTKVR